MDSPATKQQQQAVEVQHAYEISNNTQNCDSFLFRFSLTVWLKFSYTANKKWLEDVLLEKMAFLTYLDIHHNLQWKVTFYFDLK